FHERVGAGDVVVGLPDREDPGGACSDRIEGARAGGERRGGHDRPGVAVPVLGEGLVRAGASELLADGPDVIRPGGRHPVEMVAAAAGVRGGYGGPVPTVPVLDQGPEPAVAALLVADGPYVGGRHGRGAVQEVALRARLRGVH